MKQLLVSYTSPLYEPLMLIKGILIFLLGPIDLQLAYLLLAIGIDFAFGIQIAVRDKAFKWCILFQKLRQKIIVYTLWIIMFHAFDMVVGLPNSARWAVIVLLAGLEIMSAIKNTARLGYGRLADALEGLYLALAKQQPHHFDEEKEKGGNKDDEETNK